MMHGQKNIYNLTWLQINGSVKYTRPGYPYAWNACALFTHPQF